MSDVPAELQLLFGLMTVTQTLNAVPAVSGLAMSVLNGALDAPMTQRLSVAAITYGPMSGPPPGTPAGVADAALVSATTRCIFSRPLPVCSDVPAGSAS